jgi:hypothetical protein
LETEQAFAPFGNAYNDADVVWVVEPLQPPDNDAASVDKS